MELPPWGEQLAERLKGACDGRVRDAEACGHLAVRWRLAVHLLETFPGADHVHDGGFAFCRSPLERLLAFAAARFALEQGREALVLAPRRVCALVEWGAGSDALAAQHVERQVVSNHAQPCAGWPCGVELFFAYGLDQSPEGLRAHVFAVVCRQSSAAEPEREQPQRPLQVLGGRLAVLTDTRGEGLDGVGSLGLHSCALVWPGEGSLLRASGLVLIVYLLAGAIAAFAAFGATRHPDIPYWRRDRVALSFALGWIYSLYALVGVFVALLLEHAGWHLVSEARGGEWLNGLAYGVITYFVLRWDVIPILAPTTAPAKVLVNVFLGRFTQRLNAAAATAIERRVCDLPPEQATRLAFRLFRKYTAGRVWTGELLPGLAMSDEDELSALCDAAIVAAPTPDSDLAAREIAAIEYVHGWVCEVLIGERDGTTPIR